MKTAIIIGTVILFLLIWFLRSERKRGRRLYTMATDLENIADHEAACYYYAVAMNAGYNENLCQKKIKELWQKYGPFDFKKQLEELNADYCRDENCGEGFHSLTVSDIHKIVNFSLDSAG